MIAVLKFYEALRHAVAHNLGRPTNKLSEISISDDFKNAIKNWPTKRPGRNISSPPLIENPKIMISPHHAIMYSETCLRIARDIDQKMFELKDERFYITKTIQDHLIQTNKLTTLACSSLGRYIAYHLEQDYKIVNRDHNQLLIDYDKKGLKTLKKSYKENKER